MELARRLLAIAWLLLAATGVAGQLTHSPLVVAAAWAIAFVLVPLTSLADPRAEERLELPVAFRAAAAIAFVAPLAGVLLVEVPGASGESYLFAPYFMIMTLLGYRVLVARGPRRVIRTMVAALLLWPPLAVFLGIGCRRPGWVMPAPHWTEIASERLVLVTQLLGAVVCAVSLLAFAPRHEAMPEARVQA